jgi:hypothetical protein
MLTSVQKKEPYVSWKNSSKLVAVPSWSRPIQSNSIQLGNELRARPLKQWRKQLIPEPNSGSGVSSITIQDIPNSTIENGVICNNVDKYFAKGIVGTFGTNDTPRPCDDTCNPEKNVIKSAVATINDNYHTNSNAYMEGKCMLYSQKLSVTPIDGNKYFNQDGSIMWPSDDSKGSHCRSSIGCPNEKCNVAIYKPNNNQYAKQGAVDSSSRLARIKYNTIYENGNSFNTAWSASAANTGKYMTSTNGPYFDKYKIQVCK